MRSGESQEREALEKTKSAFQWLYHRPAQDVFDEAFTAGYRAALAAREDTERPDELDLLKRLHVFFEERSGESDERARFYEEIDHLVRVRDTEQEHGS